MTRAASPRRSPGLTKTTGSGVRFCCLRDDCDKCFRTAKARNGHMTSHVRVYTRTPIPHGTVKGYKRETFFKMPTCEACRSAWRNHVRRIDRAQRTAGKPSRSQKSWAKQIEARGTFVYDNGEWVRVD
jgi:hypothetical protein